MNDFTVRQNGQLDIEVEQSNESATSATLFMRNQDTDVVYSVTADYTDGVAQLTLTSDETSVVGVYDYQINENITDEDPIIYPSGCDGDCEFPTITVCESIVIS